jgi:hypothetical protein
MRVLGAEHYSTLLTQNASAETGHLPLLAACQGGTVAVFAGLLAEKSFHLAVVLACSLTLAYVADVPDSLCSPAAWWYLL